MDPVIDFGQDIVLFGICRAPNRKMDPYQLILAIYPGEYEESPGLEAIWTENFLIHFFDQKKYKFSKGEFWITDDSFITKDKTLHKFSRCSASLQENCPRSGESLIIIWEKEEKPLKPYLQHIDQAGYVLDGLRKAFLK